MNKCFFVFVLLVPLFCCQPRNNSGTIESNHTPPDSLIILYDWGYHLILREGPRSYRYFVEEREGVPLLSMKVIDNAVVEYMDSCINNSTPVNLYQYKTSIFHDHVDIHANCLLLRYKGNRIDTIVISENPGAFQLRDTVYRDTALYRAVTGELASRDSIWLNYSEFGALGYQEQFLGIKAAEKRYWKWWKRKVEEDRRKQRL